MLVKYYAKSYRDYGRLTAVAMYPFNLYDAPLLQLAGRWLSPQQIGETKSWPHHVNRCTFTAVWKPSDAGMKNKRNDGVGGGPCCDFQIVTSSSVFSDKGTP